MLHIRIGSTPQPADTPQTPQFRAGKMTRLIILFALFLFACAKPGAPNPPVATPDAAPAPVGEKFDVLNSDAVLAGLKASQLPVVKEVAYTDVTDDNHLLGRPHQYVSKINFEDQRIAKPKSTLNNTIESFTSAEDLENRRAYIESISKKVPLFAQYMYVHKNILLRLSFDLTPAQAKEYEAALRTL